MQSLEDSFKKKGFSKIVGIDEAGRGPLAGPVVAAAVFLSSAQFKSKITDSKLLSPKKRQAAYEEILSSCTVGIGAALVWEIDHYNILQATFLAMRRAVNMLSFRPDLCLVDGPHAIPGLVTLQKPIIKGDRLSLSIAAASIVAKVKRDEIMAHYARLYPGYGFEQNKGYGTKAHRQAILRKGRCPLHRTTFRGVGS
ncbi:MAG TPA: ribonuclease HII [Firmicutes bacterium]|nr:ribonuclease HII [Bacillota bacterium]